MTDDNMLNLDEEKDRDIRQIKELTLENNRMLHSMQRRARFGLVWKIIYWGILIGGAIGAFYFIQPYYERVQNTYTSIKQTQQQISDIPQSFSWDSIKTYFTGTSTPK